MLSVPTVVTLVVLGVIGITFSVMIYWFNLGLFLGRTIVARRNGSVGVDGSLLVYRGRPAIHEALW